MVNVLAFATKVADAPVVTQVFMDIMDTFPASHQLYQGS
jgi:hypothetical protein